MLTHRLSSEAHPSDAERPQARLIGLAPILLFMPSRTAILKDLECMVRDRCVNPPRLLIGIKRDNVYFLTDSRMFFRCF